MLGQLPYGDYFVDTQVNLPINTKKQTNSMALSPLVNCADRESAATGEANADFRGSSLLRCQGTRSLRS
jgi:hypothetical protein